MLNPLRQPGSVNLQRLFPSASFVGCADITVSAVTQDSRECTPGCLFATLPGTRSHGRTHVPEATLGGAAAILTDRPLADTSLPQCIVPNVRQAFGQICHALYGNPSQSLGVVGVTGTNGKTTTTWILRSLLENSSRPCGVIGTIEYNDGTNSVPAPFTTPDAKTISQVLAATKERKTPYAAIELSSHALDQCRTAGLQLDVGIITNITHDHLDYHNTLEDYSAAKMKIAGLIKRDGLMILNIHDPLCMELEEKLVGVVHTLTYGLDLEADISARILEMSSTGTIFELHQGILKVECKTSLIGEHNVMNCVAAAAAAMQLGVEIYDIAAAFPAVTAVPGRLEQVNCGQDFSVYVDYAHTDDALLHAIQTVRNLTSGQVTVVFGAGGERDRAKRPLMALASLQADRVIITSDNPRNEPQTQIINDILNGFGKSRDKSKVFIEVDRQDAIERALRTARPGDSVIIAGKGHEKFQVIGDDRIPFDDVAICEATIYAMQAEEVKTIPLGLAG